jgi:cystathionine beta-lyase
VIAGFNLAIHALALPDGAALAQTPIYHPILHAAKNAGATAQYNALVPRPNGNYETDWQAFESDITAQTRLFILCNPHNPQGRVFRRDELERYAEICLRRGVPICSDEIHCDLVYSEHTHIPIASLDPEISRRTITLMAPSKTFNLPGLYCSFAIIEDAELRQRYVKAGKGLLSHVNLFGYQAALAAYQYGQHWERELLVYLQENRDFLCDYVQQNLPGIRMARPEGTYLAWMDCRALALQPSPCEFFLQHARVALNDGAMFGPGGEGFMRLNFGCRRATLLEALERIKTALQPHI